MSKFSHAAVDINCKRERRHRQLHRGGEGGQKCCGSVNEKPIRIGKAAECLQCNQLREWRGGCVSSGIGETRELRYWEVLNATRE